MYIYKYLHIKYSLLGCSLGFRFWAGRLGLGLCGGKLCCKCRAARSSEELCRVQL